jgi:hypothetical protein
VIHLQQRDEHPSQPFSHWQKLFLRTYVDRLCHQFPVAVIYEAFRNALNLELVVDISPWIKQHG